MNYEEIISPFVVTTTIDLQETQDYISPAWSKDQKDYPDYKITDGEILVHRPDIMPGTYQTFMTKDTFIEAFEKWCR